MQIGARAAGSEGSGGRGHLSERPGWPSGAPISRGSTVSMIAFGGRRGPHRSGSRCRGRPIERREAGREGCLWPNAASQGRPPDTARAVKASAPLKCQNGRAKTLCGGGGGGGGSNSELPQAGFPESGEVPLHFSLERQETRTDDRGISGLLRALSALRNARQIARVPRRPRTSARVSLAPQLAHSELEQARRRHDRLGLGRRHAPAQRLHTRLQPQRRAGRRLPAEGERHGLCS